MSNKENRATPNKVSQLSAQRATRLPNQPNLVSNKTARSFPPSPHQLQFILLRPENLPTSNLTCINTSPRLVLKGKNKSRFTGRFWRGSLDAQTAIEMISRIAIIPRLSIWCIYYVVPYIGILYTCTDERRGMLDGYLTTGMAKGYVQYTLLYMKWMHEQRWRGGGGKFFIFVAMRKTMYACVNAIALASS